MMTPRGAAAQVDGARRQPQCAAAVMMVRPAAFGWNPQTQDSNRFQRFQAVRGHEAGALALAEFEALAAALRAAGVEVYAFDDRPTPACPDAVFPNNWVSFHPDGTVVLYPMLAPNRRAERRKDLLQKLTAAGGFEMHRVLDLTHFEHSGEYLEGTGSLVLDHVARVAYACLSPRTHPAPLQAFCAELGFEPFVFRATDAAGTPVYHTNVVLAVGGDVSIVAIDNVTATDRERLLERLARDGSYLATIGREQVAAFAANALELRSRAGGTVLAMSARALGSYSAAARARLAGCVDEVVAVPIPTIEALGGGSVRCMLAEVFLPRARAP